MIKHFLLRMVLFVSLFLFLFVSGILWERFIFGDITPLTMIGSMIYSMGVALFYIIETKK